MVSSMEFMSFLGRVVFVSVFILSAWQEFNEFGVDGGPAAKSLSPKFNTFAKHVSVQTGLQVPEVEMKYLVAAAIGVKALGSLFFHPWQLSWSLSAASAPGNCHSNLVRLLQLRCRHEGIYSAVCQVYTELGIVWSIALLYRHKECDAKKNQEEGSQKQDSLREKGMGLGFFCCCCCCCWYLVCQCLCELDLVLSFVCFVEHSSQCLFFSFSSRLVLTFQHLGCEF